MIPFPFTRGVYLWGEPFRVAPEEAHPEEKARELAEQMNRLSREADALAAEPTDSFPEVFFHSLYTLFLFLFCLVALPVVLGGMLFRSEAREGVRERLGRVPGEDPYTHPVWIHCASVGELEAARPLLIRLSEWIGEKKILLSFTSITGRAQARKQFPGIRSMFLPLDVPVLVRRVLRKLRPRVLVLFEAELWPNLLRGARRLHTPVLLFNGRISEGSARNYRLVRPFFRRYAAGIRYFGVKEEKDRERLVRLGIDPERIEVVGNIKLSGGNEEISSPGVLDEIRGSWHPDPGAPVLVAGSTHRGEEEILLQAFQELRGDYPALKLIIAPRKMNRLREIEKLLHQHGLSFWRRSRLTSQSGPPAPILILDSIGELRDVYAIGFLVFVGGSLVPVGGHNLVEAALRGKPVLFGPHIEKQREVAEHFLTEGFGFQVSGPREISDAVRRFIDHPELARTLGARAQASIRQEGKILERYAERIRPYISAC